MMRIIVQDINTVKQTFRIVFLRDCMYRHPNCHGCSAKLLSPCTIQPFFERFLVRRKLESNLRPVRYNLLNFRRAPLNQPGQMHCCFYRFSLKSLFFSFFQFKNLGTSKTSSIIRIQNHSGCSVLKHCNCLDNSFPRKSQTSKQQSRYTAGSRLVPLIPRT